MIQNVIRNLVGIENYGIVSLCFFCTIFAGIIVWATLRKRDYCQQMAQLPLEENQSDRNHRNSP
jgi:hypothetical protein